MHRSIASPVLSDPSPLSSSASRRLQLLSPSPKPKPFLPLQKKPAMSLHLSTPFSAPETQRALLLHAPREEYKLAQIPLPALENPDEVLIRIEAIGLNPV